MFYTFSQNNSGGHFNSPRYVIVEADNAQEANERAFDSGLVYFNGVRLGRDCECCGNRWERCSEGDGNTEPRIYGERVGKGNNEDCETVILLVDGTELSQWVYQEEKE